MKIKVVRIEEQIVTCQIMNNDEGDSLIDIARRWFNPDIKVDDIIEIDLTN